MKSLGKLFEKALVGELRGQGFEIGKRDSDVDHNAKLDFVVHRFPGSIMHHQVGVQVTVGEQNNIQKMSEFYAVHSGRYEKGVQRSIYLQADKDLDLDGGAFVIGTAITQFQFERRFANDRVIGIEVGEDLSYGLFSLQDRIGQLNANRHVPAPKSDELPVEIKSANPAPVEHTPSPETESPRPAPKAATSSATLEGNITYWIPDSGYGFMVGQDNDTYHLHFSGIADDRLRLALNAVTERTRYPLQNAVEFEPGTKRSPQDNYKSARNVRFATGKPFVA